MTSDKVLEYYKEHIGGLAPHEAHDVVNECIVIILKELSAIAPDGSVNLKQGNNIWNFCKNELEKEDYYPYMKQDQFRDAVTKSRDEVHKVNKYT